MLLDQDNNDNLPSPLNDIDFDNDIEMGELPQQNDEDNLDGGDADGEDDADHFS